MNYSLMIIGLFSIIIQWRRSESAAATDPSQCVSSGISMWLDGSSVQLNADGDVSLWQDKSGNGNNGIIEWNNGLAKSTETDPSQELYLNGEPVLSGIGGHSVGLQPNDGIKLGSDMDVKGNWALFNLCKYRDSAPHNRKLSIIQGELGGSFFGFAQDQNGVAKTSPEWMTAYGNKFPSTSWVLSTTTPTLYKGNGKDYTLRDGNVNQRQLNNHVGQLWINWGSNHQWPSDFACAEILLIENKQLTDSEIGCIEDYFACKYGIALDGKPNLDCGCSSNSDCGANGVCNADKTCSCADGYEGDPDNGALCADKDECTSGTHNCNPNAICNNNVGSFECVCIDGYSGNGQTCTDDNECSLGTDDCDDNASCTNTVGGFECECKDGYTGNGKTCTDVDECAEGSSSCDATQGCTNNEGGHECTDSYFGFYASSLNGGVSGAPITTTLTYNGKKYTCDIRPTTSGTLYKCTFRESTDGDALASNPDNGIRFTNDNSDGVYIYRVKVYDAVNDRTWNVDKGFCLADSYGYTVGWYPSGWDRYSDRCEHYSSFNLPGSTYDYFESGAIWVDNDQCRYKVIDIYFYDGIYDEVRTEPRTRGTCNSAVSGPDNLDGDYGQGTEWRINLTSTEVFGIGGLLSIILLANIMCLCYTNCNGKRRKKKGYAVVKYDSEEFDESEANVINVAA